MAPSASSRRRQTASGFSDRSLRRDDALARSRASAAPIFLHGQRAGLDDDVSPDKRRASTQVEAGGTATSTAST
jgi:hypothetical protein